ncbi:MAG: bifunctional glutamate N-acetyltransferase/amino-acid acetyltransferase ArgJ [Lentisphaeria bacterium]
MGYEIIENGGVTSPAGFRAAGVAAGLKASGQPDVALIVSDRPAAAAASFTSNRFAAAPVLYGRDLLDKRDRIRAVVINSGNANACTGAQGFADTERMAQYTAEKLGCDASEVMVSSTGRIGVAMPMDAITVGIAAAVKGLQDTGGDLAAEAIMTTDTGPKNIACCFTATTGQQITVGGMAKGAGMIAPRMVTCGLHATMLAYITSDANVDPQFLRQCLADILPASFNRITVDGDMSTNDTVLVMANGMADNETIFENHPDAENFKAALRTVAAELARAMVLDGEGATKFVEVHVGEAVDAVQAHACANAVANSLLCKTAWFGCDPNWGRVLDAAGYADAELDPSAVSLDYNDVPVVRNGVDAGTAEAELARVMQGDKLVIKLGLGVGQAKAVVWTCDVSCEYVRINADYTT